MTKPIVEPSKQVNRIRGKLKGHAVPAKATLLATLMMKEGVEEEDAIERVTWQNPITIEMAIRYKRGREGV